MSSIQANNQPNCDLESSPGADDVDEPEPGLAAPNRRRHTRHTRHTRQSVGSQADPPSGNGSDGAKPNGDRSNGLSRCEGGSVNQKNPGPCRVSVDVLWDPEVADWQTRLGVPDGRIAEAVVAAAAEVGYGAGDIGVRITDDSSIHEINARHLSHDYPTDVISFPYSEDPSRIEGELVASVETAQQNAADAGWETANELLLYVIHGVLHIGGMDDHEDQDRAQMRVAEQAVLKRLGIDAVPASEGQRSE